MLSKFNMLSYYVAKSTEPIQAYFYLCVFLFTLYFKVLVTMLLLILVLSINEQHEFRVRV